MSRTLLARAPAALALCALTALTQACSRQSDSAPPSAPITSSPPQIDLAKVMHQVHFAFQRDADGFVGGADVYDLRANAAGFSFTPRTFTKGEKPVEGAALRFGATLITRTDWTDSATATLNRDQDGSLIRKGSALVERLRNHEGGVDQTWELAQKPNGRGDLLVRVPVSGLEFKGATDKGLHFADPNSGLGVRYSHATFVDARGVKTQLTARYDADSIELRVPARLLDESAYPAVLDPTVSPEFGTDTPVEGVRSRDAQYRPSVAFDGTNYLVVWSDRRAKRGFNYDVFGTRVTTDNRVLDLEGFPISTGNAREENPSVAFGNGNFIVAWEDDRNGSADIYGTRVSPAGAVLDAAGFLISNATGSQYTPRLAFDGTNFFAVWADARVAGSTDVYGSRVTPAGVALDPNGIAISSFPYYQYMEDIVFDGTNYFVVWADSRNSNQYDVYGARVSKSGAVLDANGIRITSLGTSETRPAVTVSPSGYFVVWEDTRNNRSDIYGARVSLAGAVTDPNGVRITPASGPGGMWPGVISAWNQYVVVWGDGAYNASNLYAARVSSSAVVIDTDPIVVSAKDKAQFIPQLSFDGTNVFMVFNDNAGDPNDGVAGARMDANGTVLDPGGKPLDLSANDQQLPVVSYGGGVFLLAWSDNRYKPTGDSDVWAVRIDPTGTVLDPSGIQLTSTTTIDQPGGLAFDGTNFMLAVYSPIAGSTKASAVRVKPNGVVMDATPIPVVTTPMAAAPTLAYGNGQFLFAWTDVRQTGSWGDIYGARVTSAGAPLDGTGIPLVVGKGYRYGGVTVSSDGNNFFVVYRDSTYDLSGVRVSGAGTALDPGGIQLVQTTSIIENLPDITFGSGNYFMVWTTNGATSIANAARIATDGGMLGAPFVIADAGVTNVEFDGTNYVAENVASSVLNAVRVAPDGTVIDNPPFAAACTAYASGGAMASDLNGKQLVAYNYPPPNGSQFTSRLLSRFLITKPNGSPVATPQTLTTTEDVPLSVVLAGSDPDGNTLTFLLGTRPANGTLTGTPPNLTYTPNPNFAGTDQFTFKVYDGTEPSAYATVTINVTGVNDAPVAPSQTLSVRQSTARSFTLAANDADGDPLTYTVLTNPTQGTLSGTAPNLVYTPTGSFVGTDSFTWKVNDGTVDSATATLTFTVAANGAPTANAQSVTLNEDVPTAIRLSGTDPNGDPLTYTVVTQPSNGTLTGTAPSLTYRPNLNWSGSDSFTFKVSDGLLDSATATVSLSVGAVNDAPIAKSQVVTGIEDTPTNITLTGYDAEGAALTYVIDTLPVSGTLTGTPPNVTFTPVTNATTSVSFSFHVNDGVRDSSPANVVINITPVNDVPIASDISRSSNEDSQVGVTLSAYDPESNPITYAVVTQPAHGTLSGTPPNLTYMPQANWNGTDTFTYKANDATAGDSNIATVTVTVAPVNDAPVPNAQTVNGTEDTPVSFTLTGSDVDGDPLTFTVTGVYAGTVSGTPPNLTFTPNANYASTAYVSFSVSDGLITSGTATVTIVLAPTPDAPTANNVQVTTAEDTQATVYFSATDPDGTSAFTYTVLTQPAHGTLSGTGSTYRWYQPDPNWNGTDSFTYKANDGALDSPPATVTITVTPVDDPPTVPTVSVSLDEDSSAPVTLLGSDPEGTAVTFTVTTQPARGTLSGVAPNLTFTATPNANGYDGFQYRVTDATGKSTVSTANIYITPINDTPTADDVAVTTNEDTMVGITLAGNDAETTSLTYTIVTPPSHGTLTGTGKTRTYSPSLDWNGTDTFTYSASDGLLTSNIATVAITVNAVEDAPRATSQTVTTPEETAVNITLGGMDPEGAAITYAVLTQPTRGTLSGSAPNLTFTPNTNAYGGDWFSFRVNDGALNSATAYVTINITNVNDAPVASPSAVTTNEDTTVSVPLQVSDPDPNTTLSYTIVTPPTKGTLTNGTGNVKFYKPNLNANGTDSFTFKASDGTLESNVETVTVTITPVNDVPVAQGKSVTLPTNGGAVTLTATDADNDPLTWTILTQPVGGTLSGTAPNLTFTPDPGTTSTSFTFKVNDGTVDSNTATVYLTLTSANIAPTVTASADLTNPFEGQTVTFSSTAADANGDTLTFAWDFGDGATSTQPNATHAYANEGTYTARITVSDGSANSSATVVITVQNAAPALVPSTEMVNGEEASPIAFSVAVTDPGVNDVVTVTWDWGDDTDPSTGTNATHSYADDGSYTVTVTATDNAGATTTGTRSVTVSNVAPVPSQQPGLSTVFGTEVTAQLQATDRAGAADPLTWSLVDGGGEVSDAGVYRWTPTDADLGHHVITARVMDDEGGQADSVFEVDVTAPTEGGTDGGTDAGTGSGGGAGGGGGGDDGTVTGNGCGCSAGSGAFSLLWAAAFAAMIRRRRTR